MAKGDDIEDRLVNFAVRIVRLCENMPKSRAGNHIAGQILRSGTAPVAHYAEARGAESTKDFVHKLKIAQKELNESRIWLRIIMQSKLISAHMIGDIFTECDELCRIINASIKTIKSRQAEK